jgi:hypothetical protein
MYVCDGHYFGTLPTTLPVRVVAGSCAIGCERPCLCASRRCSRSAASSFCTVASDSLCTRPLRNSSAHFGLRLSEICAKHRILELYTVLHMGHVPVASTKYGNSHSTLCLVLMWDSSARDVLQLGLLPLASAGHFMHTYVCISLLCVLTLLELSDVESVKYMSCTSWSQLHFIEND